MVEICLIVLGIIAVIASFWLGEKLSPEQTFVKEQTAEELKREIEEAVANFRNNARELSEEAQEVTERELEKICNEKIMAIHEDSDSVFEEIEKNHQEAVFLYSMLEEKKKEIESFISSLREETQETREMVQDMMLARDIAQMMEQEIIMGRKVVENIQQTTQDCQTVLQEIVDAIDGAAEEAEAQGIRRVREAAEEAETQGLQRVRNAEEAAERATEKVTEKAARLATEAKELENRIEESLRKSSQIEQAAKISDAAERADKPEGTTLKQPEKRQIEKRQPERRPAEKQMLERRPVEKKIPEEKKPLRRSFYAESRTEEDASGKDLVGADTVELKEIIERDTEVQKAGRRSLRSAGRKPAEAKSEKVLESVAKTLTRTQKAMAEKTGDAGASPEDENFNQKILRMHKEGMSETEIAKQLSMGVGEVKLVIGLFEGARR